MPPQAWNPAKDTFYLSKKCLYPVNGLSVSSNPREWGDKTLNFRGEIKAGEIHFPGAVRIREHAHSLFIAPSQK